MNGKTGKIIIALLSVCLGVVCWTGWLSWSTKEQLAQRGGGLTLWNEYRDIRGVVQHIAYTRDPVKETELEALDHLDALTEVRLLEFPKGKD